MVLGKTVDDLPTANSRQWRVMDNSVYLGVVGMIIEIHNHISVMLLSA